MQGVPKMPLSFWNPLNLEETFLGQPVVAENLQNLPRPDIIPLMIAPIFVNTNTVP